jgi:hypothetical protein
VKKQVSYTSPPPTLARVPPDAVRKVLGEKGIVNNDGAKNRRCRRKDRCLCRCRRALLVGMISDGGANDVERDRPRRCGG